MDSMANNSGRRRSTRLPCRLSITLTGADQCHSYSEPCLVILVSPYGCAARFGRPVEVGSTVLLGGLPSSSNVTAQVVNCISIEDYQHLWLLGLELNEPGNVWGIQSPPSDWIS
jgi:hypothetical protein